MSKSYQEVENLVHQWGCNRGIVQNGKPMGQAIKVLEECTELIDAINRCAESEVEDAIGDVMVALHMCAATMDMNVLHCFELAYNVIKERKGFLRSDGQFIKEPS